MAPYSVKQRWIWAMFSLSDTTAPPITYIFQNTLLMPWRQTQEANRPVPRMVMAKKQSRAYRHQKTPSSVPAATATDSSVTAAVTRNLAAGRTSVCRMAQAAQCAVVPVDMGMAGDSVPGVVNCRIAAGTQDFTQGPAMTRAEAIDAIAAGIALVRAQKAQGVHLLATGEMGIGNTTTSSAVAAVLLGQPIETMTGRGAGLSDEGLARKMDAIRRGIAVNTPDAADPLDVLAKLGGFDLAGLCGVFLGGALEGIPVLMDGFISGVAALCAVRLCPAAAKAVFASHCSSEPAARLVLEALGKIPLLTAGLHLGEGTGAVASIPLWDMALAVYDHCYSFAEGGITPYTPQC